ncbi:Aspartate--ammonia ligase [Histomonas meleagridis]|uniref:Aspartate--ammonia ligase n=1 Tax=Histomonas meleagridis TaxID=135588 RepID=UPI003559F2E2|nr:Aspartate--ammonia ligase [Histomonas meleagridis]KAH0805832.1 Aspartate--ammonia ligase [Histomonas meleagridis]
MNKLIIPKGYSTPLKLIDLQVAIKLAKDTFEHKLAEKLNLTRISAPLFVKPETGLNDNLNGVERPVSFDVPAVDATVQIVQSLAKWKRFALGKYGFKPGQGLYTDMNAIRRDEEPDNLHSIYVDQWDWEKVITAEQRNIETLKSTVTLIIEALKETESIICSQFTQLKPFIQTEIKFITSQELEDMYPNLTPRQRENEICKQYGTVFLGQIGGLLKSGTKHDGRSPDYDDWSLNGDIIMWNPVLEEAFEISSMGIRVNKESLEKQLKESGCEDRKGLLYHRMLLEDKLPLTIGGGIGQSRLCMLLLHCAHIGEVQVSIWPDEMVKKCEENGINLL